MAKLVGRKPVEIKLYDQQNGRVPLFDSASKSWITVDRSVLTSGSAFISGSQTFIGNQTVSGSLTVTQGITGSLFGTASYADNAWALGGNTFTGGAADRVLGTLSNHHLSIYASGSRVATFTNSGSLFIAPYLPGILNDEKFLVDAGVTTSPDLIRALSDINSYSQINIQNFNSGSSASSDIIATANNGSEFNQYVNMGINSSTFSGSIGAANDAYLYSTGNDLHIGNASNKPIQFFAGGIDTDTNRKLQLNPNNLHQMTGSLDVSGSIVARSFTGSLFGTASNATTASYWSGSIINAATASYVLQAESASYWSGSIINAATASYVLQAISASYATLALTASNANTASYIENAQSASYWSGSITNAATASYVENAQTASYVQNSQTASYVLNAVSASYAQTASSADDFTVRGTLTAQTIVAQTITSSIEFVTGSTRNGSLLTNTHQFTGSVGITGSLGINGVDYATISGSASTRLTALEVFSGSYSTGSFTGSFIGRVTGSFSGSLHNLQNTVLGHIPFFTSSQVLADSVIRQLDNGTGSYSIVINQDDITTAAPEALYVYQPSSASYNVISGKGNLNNYLQLNIQNTNTGENASSDVVATANNGNESVNFINMGINSEGFTGSIGDANDAYLYSTGNELHIGNASNFPVQFFAGGLDNNANKKFQLNPNNSHQMTGSLDVSGSIVARSFTGSLQGTASWANNAINTTSASYALTSSYVLNAQSASYVLQAESASYWSGSIINAATASYVKNAETASYILNAVSASYAANADLLDGKDSTIFATTGSNVFVGNQIITGSFTVSGSTTQIGNTTLTGSITVSGPLRLDPTIDPGQISTTSSFLFTSASNTATGYDLYYRQGDNKVKFKWFEGVLNTGILYGGILTYSASNFYVSSGSGIIVNHNATTGSEISPTITYVNWAASTHSISNPTAQNTYVFIDASGNLQQQTSFFTPEQYHEALPIGRISHYGATGSLVTGVGNNMLTTYDVPQQLGEFTRAFGPLKVSGFTITPQVGSLSLNIGSGTAFNLGGYYQNSPDLPSTYNSNTYVTSSIIRIHRSGSGFLFDNNGGAYYTTVNPLVYDDGDGTLATVGSGNWSIQRVFVNPITGRSHVYYGQSVYTTYLNAVQSVATDDFVESEVTKNAYVFAGYLVMKGGAANDDLSVGDTTNAIIQAGLFRNSVGGSGGAGAAVSNINDLSDVNITSPSNGQALIYNSGNWVNGNPISASFALTASYISGSGGGVGFPFSGSAVITGSFLVSSSFVDFTKATYVTGSFTGSLQGTSSFATTSSHALYAAYAGNSPGLTVAFTQSVAATTWSFTHNLNTRNPLLQVYDSTYHQIVPLEIIGSDPNQATIYFDAPESGFAIASNGGTLTVNGSTARLDQTSTAVTWSFQHNLATRYPNFIIYDSTDNVVIPAGIHAISDMEAEIYFAFPSTGVAIANFSGISGSINIATSSFATTASFASFALNATSASHAVTASYLLGQSPTSSYALTASYVELSLAAVSASYALTSSYAVNATTASYGNNFIVGNTLTIDQTLTDYHTVPSSIVGSNNMFNLATGSYSSAFFKYTVANGANARTGEVMAVWNGGSIQYTDNSTVDIGDTSTVIAEAAIAASSIQFNITTATSGWKLKSLGTFM
jgi:hypothetical protein